MENVSNVLTIVNNEELHAIVIEATTSQKLQIKEAKNAQEAMKLKDEYKFDFIVIEQKYPSFDLQKFVQDLRKKETKTQTKDQTPVFILGNDAKKYYKIVQNFDFCKFVKLPIDSTTFTSTFLSLPWNTPSIGEEITHLTKGEFLIKEGEESDEMYWIVSGKLGILKKNQKDENIAIGEIYPGELVGEMGFLESMNRSASVKAIEESDVIVIPHDKFINLFDSQPLWFRSLMRVLSARLRKANQVIAQKEVHSNNDIQLDQDEIDKLIQQGLTKGF